ncbi:MipA/OmpV family protein [Deferribacterales bacterium RsTz2092]|nr:putative outer membrane protein YiaT [Deferribacterales bacterium]
MKRVYLVLLCVIAFSGNALAVEVMAGGGLMYVDREYKGTKSGLDRYKDITWNVFDDDYSGPLPFISVDSDSFFWKMATFGYHAYRDNSTQFNIILAHIGKDFDPDSSDNETIKRLHKRPSTMGMGFSFEKKTLLGEFKATAMGDILNISNSILAELSYGYGIRFGMRFSLTPSVSVRWANKKFNEYYYGINRDDNRRSGIDRYEPSDGWMPAVGLSAMYMFSKQNILMVHGEYSFLSSATKDSPLVDKNGVFGMFGGFMHRF